MYTAVARRCTPCTPSRHGVNGRVHGNIHGTYTAVHMGRKHGRKHGRVRGHGRTMYMVRARPCTQSVHGRERPCTDCEHGRTRAMQLVRPCPEHGRVRSRYVAKHGRVRGPYPTVYVPYTWPCTGRVLRLHGRLYGPCARPCTYHVHGRAWSVHDPNTAVYTVVYPVHGRVYGPCTWPCAVYMHVFVACVYGRSRPCTDCIRTMYMVRSWPDRGGGPHTAVFTARAVYTAVDGVYGPCTPRHGAVQASQKLTTETCWTAITQIQ